MLLEQNPGEAKKLYADLMNENPGVRGYRYNYAIASIMVDDFDEAIKDLNLVIREGYRDPDMAIRPAIKRLSRQKPEEFKKLVALLTEEDQALQENP